MFQEERDQSQFEGSMLGDHTGEAVVGNIGSVKRSSSMGRYWASEVGLRYSLQQTVTYVQMTDVIQGDNNLAYYTLAFAAKWAVYNDSPSATAGWLSTQIKFKPNLSDNGHTQSAKSNLGTITEDT